MNQSTMDAEVLKAEKLRTTILCIIFCLMSLLCALFILFFPNSFSISKVSTIYLPPYLMGVGLYFLLVRRVICRYIAKKKGMPIVLRYFNTFVEISIPSIGMILATLVQPPVYVLLMPSVLVYYIFITLSSLTLNEWLCRFSGLVAAAEYGALSYFILNYTYIENIDNFLTAGFSYVSRVICLFIGGIVTGFVTNQIKQHLFSVFEAQKERDRIEDIFGKHVSPEVVTKLLSKNSNLTEYLPVCIMFLDIRNFTHFAEENKPEVVVNYLNNLFDHMIKIIHHNKGIINKFLGDGFMAVFGAPLSNGNDVANAVKAAMAIIHHAEQEIKKGALPDLKLGIGLHFGKALTTTIGTIS
ncbi:adenylate/guanylate cyclase domain-containing protein [Legionella sp. km772]|nr:adenylate/guanylate cyclase domain-containing protein [Legionella sp. km772]